MELIGFKLEKNKKTIIHEKNINCINNSQGLVFRLNNEKYIFNNNKLIKQTKNEIITLDFNNNKCIIDLLDTKHNITVNILKSTVKKDKNNIKIEYIIETEEDSINIISIEYKKSS